MPVDPILVYVVVVSAIGLALLVRVLFSLRRNARVRVAQVERRTLTDAVESDGGPVQNLEAQATERAIESIESRFTVTRRLAIPMVILGTVLILSLPFLTLVPAALVSVVAAVITVTIGVAARPVIENAIAGLTISFSKVIRIGDTVLLDGHYGTIEDITITHTTLKRWDWKRYVIPNAQMLQSKVLNYTLFDDFLWPYVEFWVSYEADLSLVKEIAVEATRASPHFAAYEDPRFWVMETAKEGIQCWVAGWADGPANAWMLTHDIRTELALRFREEGIRAHRYDHSLTTRDAAAL
jgi:small-conductance mechanosensitive channel